MLENIEIYADGANLEDMLEAYRSGKVSGFTTNPSLMKKAGIDNYLGFARQVLQKIPDAPISFEVFGDDIATMKQEALTLAELSENVFVKIPIVTTSGVSTLELISDLSNNRVKVNVTAVMLISQVEEIVAATNDTVPAIISVFAGRVADTGRDPVPLMANAVEICQGKPNTKLLWASTREVYNIVQAAFLHVDIITCTPGILAKLPLIGRDLEELSVDTVRGFHKDALALGASIV